MKPRRKPSRTRRSPEHSGLQDQRAEVPLSSVRFLRTARISASAGTRAYLCPRTGDPASSLDTVVSRSEKAQKPNRTNRRSTCVTFDRARKKALHTKGPQAEIREDLRTCSPFVQTCPACFSRLSSRSYFLMKRKEKPPRPIMRTVMTSPTFAVPSAMSQARGSSGFTSPLMK